MGLLKRVFAAKGKNMRTRDATPAQNAEIVSLLQQLAQEESDRLARRLRRLNEVPRVPVCVAVDANAALHSLVGCCLCSLTRMSQTRTPRRKEVTAVLMLVRSPNPTALSLWPPVCRSGTTSATMTDQVDLWLMPVR